MTRDPHMHARRPLPFNHHFAPQRRGRFANDHEALTRPRWLYDDDHCGDGRRGAGGGAMAFFNHHATHQTDRQKAAGATLRAPPAERFH
jgi:hypothetical protein